MSIVASAERETDIRSHLDVMTRDESRAFLRPDPMRISIDFALIWVQAGLGILVFALMPNVFGFVAGILLVSSAQHAMGHVVHEGAHYLITPGRKGLNDFIARWLFSAPILLPFSVYRRRHLLHHRHVATEEDTKELYRRDIRGARLVFEVVLSLIGIDYVRQVIAALRHDGSQQHGTTDPSLGWIREEFLAIFVTQLILFGSLTLINPWLYWLFTVSKLLGKVGSLVEHRPLMEMAGTNPDSGYYMDTETPCLRSVRASFAERFIISKINFHFHAEHHLWPSVSYQFLPKLHERLFRNPRAKQLGCTVERNYWEALQKLWSGK